MKYIITHFGSGNIGKALIAPLFLTEHYQLNFVDINEESTNFLKNNFYEVIYVNDSSSKKIKIDNIINSKLEKDKLIQQIIESDYISTSIGYQNFKFLVDDLCKAIELRTKQNPLIILCFENYKYASQYLFDLLKEKLSDLSKPKIKFINLVVDCIVTNDSNLEKVYRENFEEVVFQNNENIFPFKGPNIFSTKKYENSYYRKLYGVNGFHTILAFISKQNGYNYVKDFLKIKNYLDIKKTIIFELKIAISNLLNLDIDKVEKYLESNFSRLTNEKLNDENDRVLRNLESKILPGERICEIADYLSKNLQNSYIFDIFQLIKKETT